MRLVSRSSRPVDLRAASRFLVAVWLAVSIAEVAGADAGTTYSIQSVRAHFYYQGSGTFSDRDLFDPAMVLRNTIGGAGDATEPSGAVLVLVKVSGTFLASTKGRI